MNVQQFPSCMISFGVSVMHAGLETVLVFRLNCLRHLVRFLMCVFCLFLEQILKQIEYFYNIFKSSFENYVGDSL